ncbi:MAG: hypothetical protein ACE5GE_00730 [Phycisphaerae bacterium]
MVGLALATIWAGAGCSAALFNPEFVDVFDATGAGTVGSVENATGHVPIIFVNRLRYAPSLASFMRTLNEERRLSGIPEGVTDFNSLRPRVRLRVRVTYENGNVIEHEFVDGDGVFEFEPREENEEDLGIPITPVDPNLTENTLSRVVALCDVIRVEIVGNVQVFVPVIVRTIRVEVGDLAQQTRTLVVTDNPQFRPILPDEVDENLNVTLLRNFGVREGPGPAENLTCGSMVGIVVSGVVTVPFTAPEDNPEDSFIAQRDEVPGFVDTDVPAQVSVPGRYEFLVRVR